LWRIQFQQQEHLENYFSNEFQTKIKSCIAQMLNESTQMLFGVDSRLDELSESTTPYLAEILIDYGLKLIKFSIAGLDLDDEIKQRYKEFSLDRIRKQKEALGDKDTMTILGDDWGRQQTAKILGNVSVNPGAGGIAAAGAGLGMGMGMGAAFGGMAQQFLTPLQQQMQQPATPQPSGRFTQKSVVEEQPKEDPVAALEKLKLMLDKGLIPQEKYDTKVEEILSKM